MGRTLFNRKIIDLKMRRIELNYLQANSCLCYHQLRCFCTMSYKWDGLWFVVMVNFRLPKPFSPHSKGTRIPESRKCLPLDSGIPPTIRIRSPSPLTKNAVHVVESRIQDCVGFLDMGRPLQFIEELVPIVCL